MTRESNDRPAHPVRARDLTDATMAKLIADVAGEIRLLPALPKDWPAGEVTDIGTANGFDIDVAWRGGKLVRAEVRSHLGRTLRIRSEQGLHLQSDNASATGEITQVSTRPGDRVVITPV